MKKEAKQQQKNNIESKTEGHYLENKIRQIYREEQHSIAVKEITEAEKVEANRTGEDITERKNLHREPKQRLLKLNEEKSKNKKIKIKISVEKLSLLRIRLLASDDGVSLSSHGGSLELGDSDTRREREGK